MTTPAKRPYSRREYAGALAANAAAKPFNVALLVGTAAATAFVASAPPALAVIAALAIYLVAVLWTFFDEDEASAVLERVRGERRSAIEAGRRRVDAALLAPAIGGPLLEARAIEQRIRDTIDRAELPYAEVSAAVDELLSLMELSASRAQLLYEALAQSPPQKVAARLRELEGSDKRELIEALEHQRDVLARMGRQLGSFYDQMERVVVELETIRANLLSVSASTDVANQQRLAGDVRALRDELGAVASGMSEAFEDRA